MAGFLQWFTQQDSPQDAHVAAELCKDAFEGTRTRGCSHLSVEDLKTVASHNVIPWQMRCSSQYWMAMEVRSFVHGYRRIRELLGATSHVTRFCTQRALPCLAMPCLNFQFCRRPQL